MILKRFTAILLSSLMLLALAGCAQKEAAADAGPAGIAVQVESVTMDAISTEHMVSGQVSADQSSTIMLSSAAKCSAVYFHAGDMVEAGDIICTLDLEGTLATYNAAAIGYESASQSYYDQAAVFDQQITLAQQTLEATRALFEIGAASQLEVTQAELQLQSAIATRNTTLAQLEAGMENAKSGLEQLDIIMENVDQDGNVIAPISGVLASMTAVDGSYTNTSFPVAVINGTEGMKITVSVSESLVPQLSIGDRVDISISSIGDTFKGTIRSVDQTASMQTSLYSVTVAIPAEVEGLIAGMFADVTFHTNVNDNAVVIPTQAILTSNAVQHVFVVENDTAVYREVTTGLTGSGVTEITSGLSVGEQMVTVGQAYLQDGDAVRSVSGEA